MMTLCGGDDDDDDGDDDRNFWQWLRETKINCQAQQQPHQQQPQLQTICR